VPGDQYRLQYRLASPNVLDRLNGYLPHIARPPHLFSPPNGCQPHDLSTHRDTFAHPGWIVRSIGNYANDHEMFWSTGR